MSINTVDSEDISHLESVLGANEETIVVGPSSDMLDKILTIALSTSQGSITVYVNKSVLEDAVDPFYMASKVSELVDSGKLSLFASKSDTSTLLVNETTVYVLASVAGEELISPIVDDEAESEVLSQVDEIMRRATEYTPSARPPRALSESFATYITSEAGDDFKTAFDAVVDNGLEVTGVTLALIAGAYRGGQQYTISKWCVENDIASAATVSRRKKELEQQGVITVEKDMQDLGRPRHRLHLDGNLQNCNSIVTVLQQLAAS